ncbi:hypothetical protein [Euryhalocaulis caribicus]|uniref:hypothetical protein n=1 Tax=Euryhalocaulis caribicus TaxID=1161401 RepID=UPI0003A5D516|nr:hypothetical protein [Euryhalocaulis caribicus]
MFLWLLKAVVAGVVVATAAWLSEKKPGLAGFVVALPLASLLALAFSWFEHRDSQTSILFARSILIAVPVSYLFFAPFFFTGRTGWGFWSSYAAGFVLLILGFFIHRWVSGWLIGSGSA